ncbi:MAG: 5-(carboxyamino)imidazole ribonucleotide synthase [Erysipelotrichaceae bacterium]|nr:MAG: 5-(carboxyamino)imidazole ribonucleotide [Erysipelotrichaceae bacterium]TXT16480.1 MAG: 5-(carboxyamino)imidazole ribonucleotide synthase [Erysipelotrichaceae bacterium]
MNQRLTPPAHIGIIGGGQLGQMMALSAIQQGYKINVLDPDPSCPCAQLAETFIKADFNDVLALEHLAECSDVVTYEFENADSVLIDGFNLNGKVPQGALALTLSQHRLREKEFAQSLKIPCPNYSSIHKQEDFHQLHDFPYVIKRCRYGYDGKGQFTVKNQNDCDQLKLNFPDEYIAEQFIYFEKEISVVCACFKDGISFFEPFENVHVNGILSSSRHPAQISEQLKKLAYEYTLRIAQSLNYIGVMAVEYFVTKDGILFNEMAPRPHNSAHGTIEGCTFSQFDLHIAAITGSHQIQPKTTSLTLMLNILGQDLQSVLQKFTVMDPNHVHLHVYGKKEARTNRKVGHITLCAAQNAELQKVIEDWSIV